MAKTKAASPAKQDSTDEHDDPPRSRELVGWSTDSALLADQPLSAAGARRVLAAALGLPASALRPLDPDTTRVALSRLRALVNRADKLAERAATDDLTGALRRGTGLGALQRELDRVSRVGGRGTVVAFIDVDGLKQLNDSEGHLAGDQLLRDVVDAMRERVRSYDLVFRYGGDEFVCALVNATLDQAEPLVADIKSSIEARTGGHTVSTGLAAVESGENAEHAVARADAALYRGRRNRALKGIEEDRAERLLHVVRA